MIEKREYPRYNCKIRVKFEFYEGNPDDVDIETSKPIKGKGHLIDISRGGVFMVSNSRVCIDMPIRLSFKIKRKKYNIDGVIVRTGLLGNNPSEVVQRLAGHKIKEDAYIAIRYSSPIEEMDYTFEKYFHS